MTQDMKKDTILHTMTQGDCPSVRVTQQMRVLNDNEGRKLLKYRDKKI